ncbi:MATE family efflux transporter [Sulfuritalea hydrogenivorans]|uniref:Multidrug-efflux transporter n=1 Tax=Sulfuritalea hydrogenivorans sk43H TaxID=1223802 RepID=W0SL76_9PROT|nr:MATE family efflux transporter [Sulfuritalea hydrogenivorans]BAO31370.1 MATE efflux family protein [Sulfuritalea hydrogenivorans sk43H]
MSAPRSLPRELLHLAWPVLIAQAAVMANGVIDTLMAGRLSSVDLAAVGIGASIYAIVFVTAMGVLLALTPVVAHHYGAKRFAEIGADVRQCAWLALGLSLVAFAVLKHPDLLLRFSRLTPEVEVKVRAYLDGVAWAVPGVLFFRVFYGFTTGIGRPRPVMFFNLLGLALKAPLNWVFMYGHFGFPALGGAGCGWSTAVITWTVATLSWLWCRRDIDYAVYGVFARFEWPRLPALRELLLLGLPMGATFMVDVTAFTFMALFIARLGPETSAAHQIAANVAVFVFMVPMALGSATGVLVGQALGAGDSRRSRHAGLLGLGVGCGVALLVGTAIFFGARPLARAYTADPQVAAAAATLLAIVAFYHVADAVQAVMAQVLRGYKRSMAPMAIYAVALWGVGLGGGYLLGLTDMFGAARGAAGFWLAGVASLTIAGLGVLAYFLRISAQTIPAPAATST